MASIDGKQSKPPFLSSNKKQIISDDELANFYISLQEFYRELTYDAVQVQKEEIYYKKVAYLSRLFSKLKGLEILHSERIENSPAMIYTSNHIGSYDQFYISSILGQCPLHYLVKDKVTKWLVRWNLIYKPTGVVVVEIDNFRSWSKAKSKPIQYLLNGSKVFIFAEGSRRGESNMGDFNPGIAQVAQEAGVSVGTLAMKNTSGLFSGKPVICVGETFAISPRENLKEATQRIKSGVLNAYDEILQHENKNQQGGDFPL